MSSKSIVLEVCVDSVQSAVRLALSPLSKPSEFRYHYAPFHSAACGGADRLEVCGNLGIGGGTTPSLGLVRAIQKVVPHVPIMVGHLSQLIRTR
jgi:copper homeostasis protein